MESLESPSTNDDIKPPINLSNNYIKLEEAEIEEKKSELSESSSSSDDDEEENEKQLIIADQDDDNKEEKEKFNLTQEDTKEDETEKTVAKEESQTDESIVKVDSAKEEEHCEKNDKLEADEDFKLIESPVPKLNGNHSLSLNDGGDDNSCSSSTSSASSHNLVIDHPLAEDPPLPKPIIEDNDLFEKVHEAKSLKRKLSASENESPQFKHLHLDSEKISQDKSQQDDQQMVVSESNDIGKQIVVKSPPKAAPPYFWEKTVPPDCANEENTSAKLLRLQNISNFVEQSIVPAFAKQIHLPVKLQSPNNYDSYRLAPREPLPLHEHHFSEFPGVGVAAQVVKEPLQATTLPSPKKNYGPYPVYTSASAATTSFHSPPLTSKQLQLPTPNLYAPSKIVRSSVKETIQTTGSYEHYTTTSGLSLPAPKLNFECFKCKTAVFDSFTQLRDHHKFCLFKDNQKKFPPTTPSTTTTTDLNKLSTEKTEKSLTVAQPTELQISMPMPTKKRFYLCSSCGTYHENWNLFLHIREIHNRHVCLYCIRLFPTAEKLSLHLEIKHDLEQNHFNSEEKLRSVSKVDGNSRFLMCCTCQHVFSEHERFSDHVCSEYIQPCSLCSQKGRHLNNCKANPEKRPKVKKKANLLPTLPAPPALTTKANNKLPRVSMATATATTPMQVCDNKLNNNNSNQMILPTLPITMPSKPPTSFEFSKQNGFFEPPSAYGFSVTKPAEDTTYHSDDSTNMVIDETCITTNYFHQMPAINPFKALDERERLQEEVNTSTGTKTSLPPDRVAEAIPEPKPLIVPKIKLRVPKEFQKAVESEISSTDSDDEEEEEEEDADEEKEENDTQKHQTLDVSSENNGISRGENSDDNDSSSTEEKDTTQDDGEESNSNLDRILKEIEKTKLDILRTKEMLEPMTNLKRVAPAIVNPPLESPVEEMSIDAPVELVVDDHVEVLAEEKPTEVAMEEHEEPTPTDSSTQPEDQDMSPLKDDNVLWSWNTPEYGMCSPTPPPTPNSVWMSPVYQPEDSPTILQAVSERENIENMEKESEHVKEITSESEKIDSSAELDVESVQTQEESTMDIEEKAHQTPPHSSPIQVMDFSPSVESKTTDDIMPTPEKATPEIDDEDEEIEVVKEHIPPADGIEVANDDVLITDLLLDRPIEKFEIIEFVRLCVKAVFSLCLYCNHAKRIAVCGHSLVLHLLAQHRFAATVDSITAEELLPSTIVSKLKSFLPELEEHYFNLETYSTISPKEVPNVVSNERVFECFQCRFSTKMHKDLYLHNRKMHLKTAILCFMCRSNFFSFSEILCHVCPGTPNKVAVFDIKFRCCLCDVDGIPSPFRLMVHLRKKHFACDICLEDCQEQGKLSSHVWKHKLHHLCYRCGIAYRNKMDITKHLFWKHGTESIICKRCLQKRWRHVYHFCVPPASFACDECNLCFSKATYLKVHQRIHSGDFRYPCTEDNCEEKFVSRKLLLKHSATHAPPEIKTEVKADCEAETTDQAVVEDVKVEDNAQEEKPPVQEPNEVKEELKPDENKVEESPEPASKRKKKKSRNKESLEDLNLIAPNLSESDSSGESDTEGPKTEDKESLVPNVMLSPPSEEEKEDDKESAKDPKDAGKIMDIWENFKSFQASQQPKKEDDDDMKSFTDSDYPTPILHVASSDHDYCAMFKIRQRVVVEDRSAADLPVDPEPVDMMSDTEQQTHDASLQKEDISPSKKKLKSSGSGSSSSGSSSESSSRSSCSCKTNCSCSSSSSDSGSSSSSEDSDSSTSEGRRRIAKKRQERADRSRLKSESSQKISISENVDVGVDDKQPLVPEIIENLEPILVETDFETAESETDEEFYDEHPQKLASEILAQKRLQLQEQMRLSPSHNFDIMENSRPSTPSLPEEMVKEKKVKLKKKKRDRKSTSKSQGVPPIKLNLSVNKVEILSNEPVIHQTSMQVPEVDPVPPYDLIASPGVAEPPIAQQPVLTTNLPNQTVKPVPFFHTRMSEGSSCSDADSSLKRSQRARRPNKFYGYTSDDENMPGTPLMIGTRTFKPQPPPQLTWRKEDLPAPSKSILLGKQPRTPKTTVGTGGQTKKRVHQKSSSKKKQHRLPPIPTLKIRPPKFGTPPVAAVLPPPSPVPANHTYSSSRDDSDDSDSSDDDLDLLPPNTVPSTAPPVQTWNASLPPVVVKPPTPPPPQASVFNQKIPPALLPNPDLATIQYFKRNNIRYPIRPPAGARQPRDGESVYCYCRCPYDEVSEMIACDGENCLIEWFHFECVGIMVAPQGKWFCAECRPKYSNELYPQLL